MKLRSRIIAALGTAVISAGVHAQAFPTKPIRVIIGFGPGGVTDVLNRIVADEVGRLIGQPLTVENRPGANALVAATAVKNAAPDGYTLYGGSTTGFHPIYMKSGIDASKEFTPISTYAYGDWFLYAASSTGVTSLKELGEFVKKQPGKIRFSSPNAGNTLLMTVVAKSMGFEFEDIPYKTTDQTIAALLTGDGHVTFNAASGFDPHIQTGKIRAISTLSPIRSPVRPEVQTAREQGVDLEVRFNIGQWGPAGLPKEVTSKLNAAVREALKAPAVAERIRNAALTPTPASAEEMIRDFNREIAFYRGAMKLTGFQAQ